MSVNEEYKTIKSSGVSFVFDAVCLPPDLQIPLHSQASWELSCIITGKVRDFCLMCQSRLLKVRW